VGRKKRENFKGIGMQSEGKRKYSRRGGIAKCGISKYSGRKKKFLEEEGVNLFFDQNTDPGPDIC
jgi:hypothetical protein